MVTSNARVSFATLQDLSPLQRVRIEVPRWSFVKRKGDGRVDVISPLPCPYNYGCIEDIVAADGDGLDALVLGPRLAAGVLVETTVRAVFGFCDAGVEDPKLVCSAVPLTAAERRGIERFFWAYAWFKRGIHRVRGESGTTTALGWLSSPWARAASSSS
ncbi:MAG: inorganic diphosphatase [Deltaproteobacteria bacterium]|nr:inorganic diphosphatase [Deltaproteobacteria bacterium]MBK8240015.1 inorganic diphosphatase [Deltaproteobacteria bacterium]MBP7289909.1 inorganic diphosphatase [Nannocystaceae bacterium]